MPLSRRILAATSLILALGATSAHAAARPAVVNGRLYDAPSYMGFVLAADEQVKEVAACSGAAIRPNVLLTAAHCFIDAAHHKWLGRDAIVFGQNDPVHATDAIADPVVHGYISSGYRRLADGISLNDVAVVQLQNPAPGTVSLIRGGNRRLARTGTSAAVLGWGVTTGVESSGPAALHRADLTIQSSRYCGQFARDFIPSHMLCAWSATESLCYGDSGGPLLVRGPSGGVVVAGVANNVVPHCTPGRAAIFANLAGGPVSAWVRHYSAILQKRADAAKAKLPVPTIPAPPATPTTPATPATPAPATTPPPLP